MGDDSGYQKALNFFKNNKVTENQQENLSGYQKALNVFNRQNNESIPTQNVQNNNKSNVKGIIANYFKGLARTGGGLLDLATEAVQGGAPDDADVVFNAFSGEGSVDPVTGKKDLIARKNELNDEIRKLKMNKFNFNLAKKHGEVIDTLAGEEVTPTTGPEKWADFAGSLSFPVKAKIGGPGGLVDSAKWGAGISAVAQVLKSQGMDEGTSEILASLGLPTLTAIRNIPKEAFKSISAKIASLTNDEFAKGVAVEKASDFLKQKVGQENIPDVVSKIKEYRTPFPGDPAKLEAPYKPITAEVADNAGLSLYHRAKSESIPSVVEREAENHQVLQREIKKLVDSGISPQAAQEFVMRERESILSGLGEKEAVARAGVENAERQFQDTAGASTAGEAVQDYLEKHVESIGSRAREESKPFYDAAKPKSVGNGLPTTFKYIDGLIDEWGKTGPIGADLAKSKEYIENALLKKPEKQNVSKKYGSNKALEEGLKKHGVNFESENNAGFNVGKLDKAKQKISLMIESIPKNEKTRRGALKGLLDRLEKDMESVPEIFEARKVYREIMEPANYITENPVLGKILDKKKGYTKQFTVTHDEVPKKLISSLKSTEGANTFMNEFSGLGTEEHSKALNNLKSYINSEILHEFVDTSGKVSPDKFSRWKKQNPGAFIIYPELDGKLSNLKNAQAYVDHIIEMNKQTLKEFDGEVVQHFLGTKYKGVDPDKIAKRILESGNSEKLMDEAVELLGRDKSGKAMEAFKKGIIDDLGRKFKSDKFTFATFNNYLKTNQKNLQKVFSEDEIKVMQKVRGILEKEAKIKGAGRQGSDTIPKLAENLAEAKGGESHKSFIGGKVDSLLGKVSDMSNKKVESMKLDLLKKALLDKKMTKFLLEFDVKNQKPPKDFWESMARSIKDRKGIKSAFSEAGEDLRDNLYVTSKALGTSLLRNKEQ